jgi:hypothetical protein
MPESPDAVSVHIDIDLTFGTQTFASIVQRSQKIAIDGTDGRTLRISLVRSYKN